MAQVNQTMRGRSLGPVILTVGVLLASNIFSNRLLPTWAYVPWNVAATGLLLLLARRVDHLRRIDLGLANVGRGLRTGTMLMTAVLAVYVVAWVIPATRGLFNDRRVGDRTLPELLYEVVIRIPLGTVLLEEVAFRGVLLGQLSRRLRLRTALFVSALLFGLWHVLPAWAINTVNPVLRGAGVSRPIAILGAVASTTVAGLFMGWVRLRARSLLAPMLLHVATNSFGYIVAWLVLRN